MNRPEPYSDKAYNRSPAGKERRGRYRHDRSRYTTNAKYLSRDIVFVDGEGINLPDGSHSYVMLGISGEKPLIDPNGLDTPRILRYLFSHLSSQNINCIYGGSYDFNMWLKGIPEEHLRRIYNSNYLSPDVDLYGYGVKWQKGKGFTITKDKRQVTINDVVSFFQAPFVTACDQYLQDSNLWIEHREMVIREKAKRGDFTLDEIDEINAYNQVELSLGIELVSELRERLNRVNLRPRRWNGPGAIAAALFTREKVKDHLADVPEPVARAARFAYMGGRFEMIKYGSVKQKVYEYDVNSAYPFALSEVPSLRDGLWSHHDGDISSHPYALYRVRYHGSRSDIPGPVAVRASTGTVSFPTNAETWVWSPEMEVLRRYCDLVEGSTYKVVEAWSFRPSNLERPFKFVPAMYTQRQELKQMGDGAQLALKLALNSMYGKTAQQVGWVAGTESAPMRIPPYHQLEWAGYITSRTRAMVLGACLESLEALESVVAFETDAVFTTRPLEQVPLSSALGDWELKEFDSLTYVQSGHYYGTLSDSPHNGKDVGKEVVKCRGIDRGFVSREQVENKLQLPESERILPAMLTRFYGAGVALARGLDKYWCRWITEPKNMSLFPTGKRIHTTCATCDGVGLSTSDWHTTICPVTGGVSHEFPVEWINPNPLMTELGDFRRMEVDFDTD